MTTVSRDLFGRELLQAACASLGFACLLRMLLRSYRLFRVEPFSHEANIMVHAFFMVALLIALGAMVALHARTDKLFLGSRAFAVGASAACMVMYWVAEALVAPAFELAPFAGVVVVFAYAIPLAACVCSWGCVLYKLDLTHALVALAAVPTILSIFTFLAVELPVKSAVITGIAAVVMVCCCYFAYGTGPYPSPRFGREEFGALPAPALAVLVSGVYACAIATGVLSLDDLDRTNAGELAGMFAISLIVSAALALCIALGPTARRHRVDVVIQVVCVLLVIGVLLVAIGFTLLGSSSRLPASLLAVARRFCIVGCFMLLTKAMQKRTFSPTVLYGLFSIVGIVIPQIIQGPVTPVVNSAANDALLQNQGIVVLVISGALIFATFILLVPIKDADAEEDAAVEAHERTVQEAYDTIARGYGLTVREQEVMQLIAEGNSMRKVGELLFISLGTVQSHAKKIYKKLDIHSRQELLDLIDRHSS